MDISMEEKMMTWDAALRPVPASELCFAAAVSLMPSLEKIDFI
jgi:hypothetical protein